MTEKTADAARAAADAVDAAAWSSARAAADAVGAAAWSSARAAADADFWETIDPIGVLARMTYLTGGENE